jgi:hypothetical protein
VKEGEEKGGKANSYNDNVVTSPDILLNTTLKKERGRERKERKREKNVG